MKFASAFALAAGILASVAAATPYDPSMLSPRDDDQADVEAIIANITDLFYQQLPATGSGCTQENVVYRREYGTLTSAEKLEYINAVKCLQQLPNRTPANVSAGARSRFDDFTVTHIQQTLTIHFTGNFMLWHRWFVYQYESALRNECNYTGYQPYWDWPLYASAPEDSPLFDGTPTSLGGNGEWVPHEGPVITPPASVSGGDIQLPAGTGGGYVVTGAFANMTVNLGPVGGLANESAGPDGGLGYNPRKLKRDLGGAMNTRYANYTTVKNLLLKPDITEYRLLSEGVPYTVEIGPHGGIHYTIGGDPGGDLYTSPADPAFWVHHSNMDRMYTLWQTIDPAIRKTDINATQYGHITWANDPESRYTLLNDTIDMGYAAPSTTISEIMDTISGPLCYFYL